MICEEALWHRSRTLHRSLVGSRHSRHKCAEREHEINRVHFMHYTATDCETRRLNDSTLSLPWGAQTFHRKTILLNQDQRSLKWRRLRSTATSVRSRASTTYLLTRPDAITPPHPLLNRSSQLKQHRRTKFLRYRLCLLCTGNANAM